MPPGTQEVHRAALSVAVAALWRELPGFWAAVRELPGFWAGVTPRQAASGMRVHTDRSLALWAPQSEGRTEAGAVCAPRRLSLHSAGRP